MDRTQIAPLRGSCQRKTSDDLPEVLAKMGVDLESVYATPEAIADVSQRLRDWRHQDFCTLPFCHTIEAEALGAHIVSGGDPAGSRPGEPTCASLSDVLHVKMPDAPQGRMAGMLASCALLTDQGEQVVFTLSGPVSILSCLIDISAFFRAWRKDKALARSVLFHLGEQILPFAQNIAEAGATAISYADPPCAPTIVGPRCAREIADEFTFEFVGRLCEEVPESVPIFLCPLTLPSVPQAAKTGRACLRCLSASTPFTL